jgi:hypothetical protein
VAAVGEVNGRYRAAPQLAARGERIMSTDELTGVQALARTHPGLPLASGKVERRACASIRHGTRACIVSRAVATGLVVAPSGGPTRTAADFLAHIQGVVATDPAATRWHCVVDNRNTHRSAALVRCVAQASGLDLELGEQGKRGILASQPSRAAFLRDPAQRIVRHDTPRHSSWRNQVAIWLSLLARKLLRRGSFTSGADLEAQVRAFIAYDNRTMAKPFQWTSHGKALVA